MAIPTTRAPAMAPCWRRRKRSTSCGCAMATISPARRRRLPMARRSSSAASSVSFHPAGHVLGSAQIKVECKGLRVVASGDYKDVPDPTCAPFELVPCDVFITEATFGLPVFRHHDAAGRNRKAAAFGRPVSRARASGRRLFARQGAARDRDAARRPVTTRRSICTARWRRSPPITRAAASSSAPVELVRGAKKSELAGTITHLPADRA